MPGDINAGFNGSASGPQGSGVNLRGLGSGSTLVLLNGHRLAPSSGIGDFVDISLIPTSAIERVEVLTDGASSIYGADAVAGVVNFVLRDDSDGVEASFCYGAVTEGVYIVHYFLTREAGETTTVKLRPTAAIAWALGGAAAFTTTFTELSLSTVPAIDAFAVSASVYAAITLAFGRRVRA